MAWQHDSTELTVKGFRRYCTLNAVDGTDDDILWDGSEEVGDVRSESEEGEGTDCEDGDGRRW